MSRIEELLPKTSAKFRRDFPELYWDAFVCASLLYKPEERREREGYIKTALLKEYSRYLKDTLAKRGLISSDASIQSILEEYRFYVEEEVEKICRDYSTNDYSSKSVWTRLGTFYLTRNGEIYTMTELTKKAIQGNVYKLLYIYFLKEFMGVEVYDDARRGYIEKERVPTIRVGKKRVPRTYLLEVLPKGIIYITGEKYLLLLGSLEETLSEYDYAIVVKAIIPKVVKADSEKVKGEYYPILEAFLVFTDTFLDIKTLSEEKMEFVSCFIYKSLAIYLRAFKGDRYFSRYQTEITEWEEHEGDIILAEFISRYLPEEDRRKILSRYTIENLESISL